MTRLILVTGSRFAKPEHQRLIGDSLRWIGGRSGIRPTLLHGDCDGVDKLADAAMRGEWDTDPMPAGWEDPCRPDCRPGHRKTRRDGRDYCPAAGIWRNQDMVDRKPWITVAFPVLGRENAGTIDCYTRAWQAGIPVWIVPLTP